MSLSVCVQVYGAGGPAADPANHPSAGQFPTNAAGHSGNTVASVPMPSPQQSALQDSANSGAGMLLNFPFPLFGWVGNIAAHLACEHERSCARVIELMRATLRVYGTQILRHYPLPLLGRGGED